ILGSVILGVFILINQEIKQKSIEKQQKITSTQKKEEECQKLLKQEEEKLIEKDSNLSFNDFEYHYNDNTKMCVLAYIKTDRLLTYYVVIDLFTRKKIFNKTNFGEKVDETIYKEWKYISTLYFSQKELRVI
ncbi:MAG: hypothetical protein WAV10_03400, partial [Minisyncoccia bacterium]